MGMPRPKIIRTASFPYHVTARANNRDWFSLPMDEVWSIYEYFLGETQSRYGLILHAFVLMANHFHLITSTPNQNLSEAMRFLLTEISREVGRRTNRINHIFGGRYRWSVLWTAYDLAYVYKYVLRNPVRAGACRRVEEYRYSSFSRLLSNSCSIPIADGFHSLWDRIPREPAARARWLNMGPSLEAEKLISLGLRRFQFALPRHKEHQLLRLELKREYGVEPVDKSGM